MGRKGGCVFTTHSLSYTHIHIRAVVSGPVSTEFPALKTFFLFSPCTKALHDEKFLLLISVW